MPRRCSVERPGPPRRQSTLSTVHGPQICWTGMVWPSMSDLPTPSPRPDAAAGSTPPRLELHFQCVCENCLAVKYPCRRVLEPCDAHPEEPPLPRAMPLSQVQVLLRSRSRSRSHFLTASPDVALRTKCTFTDAGPSFVLHQRGVVCVDDPEHTHSDSLH